MNERSGFFKKRKAADLDASLSLCELNTLVEDLKQATLKVLADKLHGFDFVLRPMVVAELFKEIINFFLNDFDTVGLRESFGMVLVQFFSNIRNRPIGIENNNNHAIFSSEWFNKVSSQNELLGESFLNRLLRRVIEKYLNLSMDKDFQKLPASQRKLSFLNNFNNVFDELVKERSHIYEMDRSPTVEEQKQQQMMVNWWL